MFFSKNLAISHLIRHGGRVAMLLGGLALGSLSATAAATGDAIPVPYNGAVKRIGVAVVSASPALETLMQSAFKIHGAFDVVAANQASYILHFDQIDAGRVNVSVEPKVAGGAAMQASGTGADWRTAAYRAGDAVVEKLTQYPGFFAGKLLFVTQRGKAREICTTDVLVQGGLQLTTDNSTSVHPRWSPDGTKFLYTGYYRTGFPDIILYNFATKTKTTFAHFEGTNTGAVYSPDGKKVAMILSANGTPQLFVADADGKNFVPLTKTSALKSSPTWSPDGKRIIISMDNGPLLYQIPATGGSLQPVPTGLPRYSGDAAWNPRDADLVAFMVQAAGSSAYNIAVFSFKTRSTQVYDDVDGEKPCWANDGRHIFFTHHDKGQDQLYILDTVTKKVRALTTRGAGDASFYYPAK